MKRPLPLKYILTFVLLFVLVCSSLSFPVLAQAANLSTAVLRFARMQQDTTNATTILVAIKPGWSTATNTIRVAFGTAYSVNSGVSAITTSTLVTQTETLTNTTVCQQPMLLKNPGATVITGNTVDFNLNVSTNLSTSTVYCFYVTGGVGVSGGATNSIENRIETMASAVVNDTSRVATATVASGADQVTVSAVVPAIFSFALSGTPTFISDLSTSTVTRTSGVTVLISTNAQAGWASWLKTSNNALTSALSAGTIATTGTIDGAPTTLSNGASAYGVAVAAGVNAPTVDPEYSATGAGASAGTPSTTLTRIAYTTAPGAGDSVLVYGKAGISTVQKSATDYTDVWTIVAAGQF